MACHVPDLGAGDRPRCLHCRLRRSRPGRRGLCLHCHAQPLVRALYGMRPRGYGVGGDGFVRGRLPELPTHHLPGTEGKTVVMAERAARRECLHHPLDAGRPAAIAAGLAGLLAADRPEPVLLPIAGVDAGRLPPRKPRGRLAEVDAGRGSP